MSVWLRLRSSLALALASGLAVARQRQGIHPEMGDDRTLVQPEEPDDPDNPMGNDDPDNQTDQADPSDQSGHDRPGQRPGLAHQPSGVSQLILSPGFQSCFNWPGWLLVVGALGSLAVLLTSRVVQANGQAQLQQLLAIEAAAIQQDLGTQLRSRLVSLDRMAQRWQVLGESSFQIWQLDARNLIQDYPGYSALVWVDTEEMIRAIVPWAGHELSLIHI